MSEIVQRVSMQQKDLKSALKNRKNIAYSPVSTETS